MFEKYHTSAMVAQTHRAVYERNEEALTVATLNARRPWYSFSQSDWIKKDKASEFTGATYNLSLDTLRERRWIGRKEYELTDHLGNVVVIFLDRKTGYGNSSGSYIGFNADVASITDYYPGGMPISERTITPSYRFGFAAGEKLNEIAGVGNHVDLGERGVDTRIVRLNWKPDPMVKQFPSQSPYVYANNSPIAMIDKEGKHGEIVIDKGKQEQGKPQIWTITATAVYVTSKEHLNASNANWEAYDRFPLEHSATFGKKIFSGESGGVSYNAKFKSSFVTFATTQEAISNLRANPVFNYITFNTGVKNPTAVDNGRYLNYNTLQRNKPNSFGHEESHIWGEQGDWRAKYDNYMSGYGLDRDVQGQEINDILSPAIELAKESKDQNVTIRVFPTQGEDGKPSDNKTTYKIYNPETKEYGKSVTVDAVNSQ